MKSSGFGAPSLARSDHGAGRRPDPPSAGDQPESPEAPDGIPGAPVATAVADGASGVPAVPDGIPDAGETDTSGSRLEDVTDPAHGVDPVSYTHLRAQETVLDLVCRLLLEKKKKKKRVKYTIRHQSQRENIKKYDV